MKVKTYSTLVACMTVMLAGFSFAAELAKIVTDPELDYAATQHPKFPAPARNEDTLIRMDLDVAGNEHPYVFLTCERFSSKVGKVWTAYQPVEGGYKRIDKCEQGQNFEFRMNFVYAGKCQGLTDEGGLLVLADTSLDGDLSRYRFGDGTATFEAGVRKLEYHNKIEDRRLAEFLFPYRLTDISDPPMKMITIEEIRSKAKGIDPVRKAIAPEEVLPAFLPPAAPAEKPLADYTPADVLGTASTKNLPDGHPFTRARLHYDGLKTKWKGAKDARSIDAMVQIILTAPAASVPYGKEESKEDWRRRREIMSAWSNLHWLMRTGMDVSDDAKVEALTRVAAAQKDPLKKAQVADFAGNMFFHHPDSRLIAILKDQLDDSTMVSFLRIDAKTTVGWTARRTAREAILSHLPHPLRMELLDTVIYGDDEVASCTALKGWLTANWAQVEAKCAEVRADPRKIVYNVALWCWYARQ